MFCVDFFEDPRGGGYGFEHFRADPEDQGRWTAVGNSGGLRFSTAAAAIDAAEAAVAWLASESWASERVASWRSQLPSDDGG